VYRSTACNQLNGVLRAAAPFILVCGTMLRADWSVSIPIFWERKHGAVIGAFRSPCLGGLCAPKKQTVHSNVREKGYRYLVYGDIAFAAIEFIFGL